MRERNGWWLLRASNTEDAFTLRCEAADEAGPQVLMARLTEQLKASGLNRPAF